LARQNEICHCKCPTRVGASHLPQGQTFHSVFKTWTPSLSAGTAIDEIFKSLGENQLKMVVVDEVIDLPKPPDHIIVDNKPIKGIKWPHHLNLSPNSNLIRIPIWLTS
jgi:hypothetical protein